MHDTFLNKNLYESILNICSKHKINKIRKLKITVHTHSHITESSIRDYFKINKKELVGDFTYIIVQREEIEPLTATIEEIDGEKSNE